MNYFKHPLSIIAALFHGSILFYVIFNKDKNSLLGCIIWCLASYFFAVTISRSYLDGRIWFLQGYGISRSQNPVKFYWQLTSSFILWLTMNGFFLYTFLML